MSEKIRKIVPLYFYTDVFCTTKLENAAAWLKQGRSVFMRYVNEENEPMTTDQIEKFTRDPFENNYFVYFVDNKEQPFLIQKRRNRPRVVTANVSFVDDHGFSIQGLDQFIKRVPSKDRSKFKMVYKEEGVTTTTAYVKSISKRDEHQPEDVVKTVTNILYFII